MSVQGIDVASYQTATFDTDGLDFVFIKATEGTSYVNPKQEEQAAHGRAAGLVVGFYGFLHPGNVQAQAQYFVEKCASQPGDVLACDWEPTSTGTASNADKDAFIKAVKALRPDHRVLLYCDLERWKNVDKTSYAGDGLWIADPNHSAGHPSIKAPWLFHQYGIRGTDRDLGNFTSRAALAAWAAGSKEDDMPLTKADVKTLATTDDVFKAPADAADYPTNKYWTLATHVEDQTQRIRATQKTVNAMAATIQTLAGMVGSGVDTAAVVAAVQSAIAEAVVHVDVDVTGPKTQEG
ncbi:muramidase [Streptomyces sp. KC 17012]|nr:muramidase [Streptomyces plumbidurans]